MTGKIYTTPLEIQGLHKHETIGLGQAANNTALRFKAPIYLVGSVLTKEDFLDVDIVMVVGKDWHGRFIGSDNPLHNAWVQHGVTQKAARWARFLWKQKEYFEQFIFYDVDFKVQTITGFQKFDPDRNPRMRLDIFGSQLPLESLKGYDYGDGPRPKDA